MAAPDVKIVPASRWRIATLPSLWSGMPTPLAWRASLGPVAPMVTARWLLVGGYALLAGGMLAALASVDTRPQIALPTAMVLAIFYAAMMRWLLGGRLSAMVKERLPLPREAVVVSAWRAAGWRLPALLVLMALVFWGLAVFLDGLRTLTGVATGALIWQLLDLRWLRRWEDEHGERLHALIRNRSRDGRVAGVYGRLG